MSNLALIAKVPDVKGAVLGDLAGSFLDAVREPDGETIAAVMGFMATLLIQAGDHLGLGTLRGVSLSGPGSARVVAVRDGVVIAASVEPARSLAAVEKALEGALQGRE